MSGLLLSFLLGISLFVAAAPARAPTPSDVPTPLASAGMLEINPSTACSDVFAAPAAFVSRACAFASAAVAPSAC
eukprot:10519561-Lingulodinium_polyedra.AAC.1